METKIDRGFFNTQYAYRKMMIGESVDESKGIDEESYKAYIVVKCKDGTEKIESGWEFSEDAKDRKNELKEDGISSRSVSRRYLKSVGLDPSNDSNWFKGNVNTLASKRKDESMETRIVVRAKDIFESSENVGDKDIWITDIDWDLEDTDADSALEAGLHTEIGVSAKDLGVDDVHKLNEDELAELISDWLSDQYGFTHKGFRYSFLK